MLLSANPTSSLPSTAPKVMHVITGLEIGGGEALLLNLAAAGLRQGRSNVIVSLMADGPMRRRFEAAGLPVDDLGMRRGLPTPSGLVRLVRLIREEKPDVVQGWLYHGCIAATLALILSGRRRSTALIHGIYGSSIDFRAYGLRVRAGFGIAALSASRADAGVYNTATGLEWHRQRGFSFRRAVTIDNGIDLDRWNTSAQLRQATRTALGLSHDEVVVLTAARVDPMKDWGCLLRVTERIPGIRLLAVGHGTRDFAAHPSRLMLGARDDMPALLAACDMFVLPSLWGEGTSVAMTEAMASQRPVVVTHVGDNARLAAGCGLVVAPGDEAALEQAIRHLADEPRTRAAFGAGGARQGAVSVWNRSGAGGLLRALRRDCQRPNRGLMGANSANRSIRVAAFTGGVNVPCARFRVPPICTGSRVRRDRCSRIMAQPH